MIDKSTIKAIAELNGIGYSETTPGHGGCIIDESGEVKNDVHFSTVTEMFDEYCYYNNIYELMAA